MSAASGQRRSDALEKIRGHLRLAVQECKLAGIQPPDAEVVLMQAAQAAVYEGNCPWNEWPKGERG